MDAYRRLKQSAREDIFEALRVWEGPLREGVDPSVVLHQVGLYAVGLLELPKDESEALYEAGT